MRNWRRRLLYVDDHKERMKQAERQDAPQREKNRELDERIEKLVSAIGEFIAQRTNAPAQWSITLFSAL
jgi:hypothetical protein